ncbi:MAG: Kelch repeat-containing protein [Sulfobacillus sp.]
MRPHRRFRPMRLVAAVVLVVVLLLVRQALIGPPVHTAPTGTTKVTTKAVSARVQVATAPSLTQAVEGDAAALVGSTIWVAGGLTAQGLSSAALTPYQPLTGPGPAVALPDRLHDAAAVGLGGQLFIFGGGRSTSSAAVSAFTPPGQFTTLLNLPTPLSDLWAADVAGQLLIGGGHNSGAPNSTVWAYHPSTNSYQTLLPLPVATRYAASAVVHNTLYVIGGETQTGASHDIIAVSASGVSRVVAQLPVAVWKAAAGVLNGQVYVFGGKVGGALTDTIYRFDPATGQVTIAGHLPQPWAYGGVASTSGAVYLLGGEGTGGALATVYRVTLVP